MKKRLNFWKDGLSINESKFSLLALLLVVGFVYGLVEHFRTGEISTNLLELIRAFLLAFVGVNAVDRVSAALESKPSQDEYTHQEGGM